MAVLSTTFERIRQALSGSYALERELGAGGMATVYLARDLKHGRDVAIKVVRPEIAAALGTERFLREIAISAHLQHPNILTLIDSGEADGLLYCVMPFINGETLRTRLARDGALPVAEAVRILRDVLDGLAYAHEHGVVHRDIKPDNIMLAGRHAFLMDFGIAKAVTEAAEGSPEPMATLTTLGLAIGTPAYMAPEQAAGEKQIDGRTDLYAIGVVAYELLTGKLPFTGGSAQALLAAQIAGTPPPLGRVRPDLPPELAEIVMRCLEKTPAARWQSAEALLARMEEYSTPASGVRARPNGSLDAPARRTRSVYRAILACMVVIVAVWWWLGPNRRVREARWAREKGIPQLLALGEAGEWRAAYTLAQKVEASIPGDSLFNALRPRFARRMSLHTDPPGAAVWQKDYAAPESTWTLLGKTPLDSVLLPNSASGFINDTRLRIVSPGRRTLDLVWFSLGDSLQLDSDTMLPPEMVRVGAAASGWSIPPGSST